MPAKSEAIFTVRDADAVAALDRMYASAEKAEGKLRELDTKASELGENKGLAKFAASADTALKAFDTKIDGSKKKIEEMKASLDDLHGKTIDIDVTGVDRALAEVLALKAAISGLDGKTVSLPSEIQSALPSGYSNALNQTRDVRLSSLFSSTQPLQIGSGGRSLPAIGGGQDPTAMLMNSIDGLRDEIRRSNDAGQGIRSGSGIPSPVRTSTGGGGGGGGGLLGMAALAAPILPGILSAIGGLGAAAGGGAAALGLGAAAAAPAMGAAMIGGGLLKVGTQPLTSGITSANQYLQQQQMAAVMAPQQLAAQQQMTAAQNQAQLAGLRAMGLGPGTQQYAQAASQMAVQAQQAKMQFQIQQQQQKAQAKAQFTAQMQNIGINPEVALELANQVSGIQAQFGRTMSGGARGGQQQRVAGRLLGYAQGPGMNMIGQAYDPFANVAERAIGSQGGGGMLGYLGSKQGQSEVQQTAQALAGVAGPLTTIAGDAARLGMTLTRDIAPFTMQLEGSLASKLGSAQEWAGSASGITAINSAFDSAKPVWGAVAGFVDQLGKGFDHLLTGGGGAAAASLINDMSRGVPGLVNWMDKGTQELPGLVTLFEDLLRALKPIFDSQGLLPTALPILQTFTNLLGDLTKALGPVGSTALLAGGALAMRGKGGGRGGIGGGLLSMMIPGAGLLGGFGGKGGKGGAKAEASAIERMFPGKGVSSAKDVALSLGSEEEGSLGLTDLAGGALRGLGGLAVPIAVGGGIAAMGQKKGSAAGLLTGGLSGAASGALAGTMIDPGLGTAIGAVVGGGIGAVTNLLGGTSGGKTPQAPIQFGQAASAQDLSAYLGQTFTTQGRAAVPGHYQPAEGRFGPIGRRWIPGTPGTPGQYEGYGTPMAGVTSVPGMTSSQIKQEQAQAQAAFRTLTTNTAQQVVALGGIIGQLHQANLSGEQRRALLQQMAQTNAGAVTYNRFGQARGINRGNLNLIEGLGAGGRGGAQQLGRTEGSLRAQRGQLESAIQHAIRAAPSGLKGAVESALYSGDTTSIEAVSNQAQHNGALRSALQQYAQIAQGGSFQQVNQQLQAVGTAYKGLTPGQRRQETSTAQWQQQFQTEWTALSRSGGLGVDEPGTAGGRGAWNAWWQQQGGGAPAGGGASRNISAGVSGGGGTHRGAAARRDGSNVTAQARQMGSAGGGAGAVDHAMHGVMTAIFDQLTGHATVEHLQNVGPYWSHYLAVGMDSQASYTAVDAASKGLLKTVLDQWGTADAVTGTKNAAWTLTQNFAEGLQWGAQTGPGQLINKTMWNMGFNIAWSVAQGAQAGGAGAGGGAGGGGGGANAMIPANTTKANKAMLTEANTLVAAHAPYHKETPGVYSGKLPIGELERVGADCSGFVTQLLIEGGYLKSGGTTATLASELAHGPGKQVTVWDRPYGPDAHVIIDINGQWYESGGNSKYNPGGGVGHLTAKQAQGELGGGGFKAFHPVGAAQGFSGIVDGPTVFLAGEGGRSESVDISPLPPAVGGGNIRHGAIRGGGGGAGRSVVVNVNFGNVKLTGGKAEFDKFMGDFTNSVERAMHTAVKVTA